MELRLPFDPAKFLAATRADDTQYVQQVIQNIDLPDKPRTIVFHEEIGSGKTWLMLHLHREVLPQDPRVTSLCLSLAEPPAGFVPQSNEHIVNPAHLAENASPDALARELIEWIGKQDSISASTSRDADLGDQTGWLVTAVKEKFQDRILVLIFDSIFEVADWTKLAKLENALLAPLAALPHVVTILTGRGKLYPWESPYLRVNVVFPKGFVPLRPFEVSEVAEQLKAQKPDAILDAETIHKLGGGYPWVNYLLAQGRNEAEATSKAREGLLSVIDEKIRGDVARDLEALSVLDGFRESEMPKMWEADSQVRHTISNEQVQRRRKQLLDSYLMHWHDKRFQIDDPMRRVLENYLRTNEPLRWRNLHCRAYLLYQEWATEFQQSRRVFLERAEFHAQALRRANFDIDDCINFESKVESSTYTNRIVNHNPLVLTT
ncbi:MAG: hypothetical protein EYC68_19980 [Chloroflexota bacterium]|nr:MAG: hypothetical protein EYC68_19980 [Chloroflexota bacterium]